MSDELTNEEKIFFPKAKLTKGDVYHYYEKMAPLMLPLMKDHPIAMERYPDGIKKIKFFQKNVPEYFPKWFKIAKIKKKSGGFIHMAMCNTKKALLYLANYGCLTPHLWLSKYTKPNYPDRLIFDLDPATKDLLLLKESALLLKEILIDHHLTPFIMTSGHKGYHIVCPIKPDLDFDQVRKVAKHLADLACKENKKLTTHLSKSARKGKIFIDYLRNSYGQHSVAPYSIRATEHATIAMPFLWKNLKEIEPMSFSLHDFSKPKSCAWSKISAKARSLKPMLKEF